MHSHKLAPELARLVAGMDPVPDSELRLTILARQFGAQEIMALRAAGVTTGPVAGGVMAARAPFSALEQLVALPFVDYIELASPMYLEGLSTV